MHADLWFTHSEGMYCCIPTQAGVPAPASDTAISCATPCLPTYLMGSFAYAYRTGMYCWIWISDTHMRYIYIYILLDHCMQLTHHINEPM